MDFVDVVAGVSNSYHLVMEEIYEIESYEHHINSIKRLERSVNDEI